MSDAPDAARRRPPRPPRTRPLEPFAPRPSDCFAPRFAALADFARGHALAVEVDGVIVDARGLETAARELAEAEARWNERWAAFRADFLEQAARARAHEAHLLAIVAAFERSAGTHLDASERSLLRACKLKTPPKSLTTTRQRAATRHVAGKSAPDDLRGANIAEREAGAW